MLEILTVHNTVSVEHLIYHVGFLGCQILRLEIHLCQITYLHFISERPDQAIDNQICCFNLCHCHPKKHSLQANYERQVIWNLKSVMYGQLKSTNIAALQSIGWDAAAQSIQKTPTTKTACVYTSTFPPLVIQKIISK